MRHKTLKLLGRKKIFKTQEQTRDVTDAAPLEITTEFPPSYTEQKMEPSKDSKDCIRNLTRKEQRHKRLLRIVRGILTCYTGHYGDEINPT